MTGKQHDVSKNHHKLGLTWFKHSLSGQAACVIVYMCSWFASLAVRILLKKVCKQDYLVMVVRDHAYDGTGVSTAE
jgi:hypothetical protein